MLQNKNTQLNIKGILYLPIIFLFLPAFAFYFPILKGVYLFLFLIIYVLLFLLFITCKKDIIYHLLHTYKKTPLKIFILTLLLMIINSILLSFFNIASISVTFRTILVQIILYIIPIYIYFLYVINRFIKYRKFVVFFIILFWINLIVGFISYIGQLFNIEIINNIFDFFANIRILIYAKGFNFSQTNYSNYFANGLPRLDNLFAEPSHYARFLFVFLPMIYSFSNSNIKLCANIFINKLIKKTLIWFSWLSLILTQSPIFLIFSLLITLIYYRLELFYVLQKHLLKIVILLIMIFIMVPLIDWSATYLSRVLNLISNIHSYDDFAIIEQSLATRITSYINSFLIFIKYPLSGVGMGNLSNYMISQFLNSPVALTPEIYERIQQAYLTKTIFSYNQGFIYYYLAENGIIITSVLAIFLYKLYSSIDNKHVSFIGNFDKALTKGLQGSLLSLFILMFYDMTFLLLEMHIIIILSITYIYNKKRKVVDVQTNTKTIFKDI